MSDPISEALELFKQRRYQEARVLLEGIDHPSAREWLAKLNRIAPPEAPAAAPPPAPATGAELPQDRPQSERPPASANPLSAEEVQAALLRAREMIREQQYLPARELLQSLDHATAKAWLQKLEERMDSLGILPQEAPPAAAPRLETTPSPPVPEAPPSAPPPPAPPPTPEAPSPAPEPTPAPDAAPAPLTESPPAEPGSDIAPPVASLEADSSPATELSADLSISSAAAHSAHSYPDPLQQAQHLALMGDFAAAQELLAPLDDLEAELWRSKLDYAQGNADYLWLDLMGYVLTLDAPVNPDTWTCDTCQRPLLDIGGCEQRDSADCPMELLVRGIPAPEQLASALRTLYSGGDPDPILAAADADTRQDWINDLDWQLKRRVTPQDVRRSVLQMLRLRLLAMS